VESQKSRPTQTPKPAPFAAIQASLRELIGLHRQLLEACRAERQALAQADLRQIQDSTLAKQGIIEGIRQAEGQRIQAVADLALAWKRPVRDLTLPNIIIAIQGLDPKGAEQLRAGFNALTVLIERITEANDFNRSLVERSLANVNQMKRNVLGEAVPKSDTYTPQGQRAGVTGGARLISHEA
jgi:flagellar biosynthesis/type III secretory pathway chaperone